MNILGFVDCVVSITSTEFCFPIDGKAKGGDDFKKVYKWFKPRNGVYITIGNYNTTRDALIDYLRKIEELKGSKYYNIDNPKMRKANLTII